MEVFNFRNPTLDIATFQMQVTQTNFSSLIGWDEGSNPNVCSPVSLKYHTESWSCFSNNGCTNYSSAKFSGESTNEYYQVGKSDIVTVTTNMCELRISSDGYSLDIIPEVFHIQVSNKYVNFQSFLSLKIYFY